MHQYNRQNRLVSITSSGGDYTKFIYDNNGNQVSKTIGKFRPLNTGNKTIEDMVDFNLIIRKGSSYGTGVSEISLYSYDHYNRLIVFKDEDTTASYQYNAQGYRTRKTINGTMTNYLYEADKVILETGADNKTKAVQVYGSALLSRKVTASSGTQSYYYLYNAHGDVTALIEAAGAIVATYDYDAFGTLLSKTGGANSYIMYAGYQKDDENGLYYLNARYYDSVTARFISEDTYTGEKNDPLSLNLYTYCVNNPIIYDDPTGHIVNYMTVQSDGGGSNIKLNKNKLRTQTKTETTTPVIAKKNPNEIKKDQKQKQEAKNSTKSTDIVITKADGGGTKNSAENKSNNSQGMSNNKTVNNGYYISEASESENNVELPDYPYISSEEAFVLGFDSYSGGFIVGGLNIINGLTGNQQITQEVINYNKEHTYEFSDSYKMGQSVAVLSVIGSVAAASVASCTEGANNSNQMTGDAYGYTKNGSGAPIADGASDINKLNSKPLYRVMTESELNAVKDIGYLRGGREGTTYFTDSYYKNASNAQNRLSLPNEPEYILEFKITNNPTVTGGNTVKPAYGGSGGGREYFSENPVQIDIINYQKMK